MVDVVFVSMCDGVEGVICNVEEEGVLIEKGRGGAIQIGPLSIEGIGGKNI